MENQNKEEVTKFLKENDEMFKFIKDISQALGSFGSLVELMEGINGKKMTPEQKQILSNMTGLSPVTANEETSWLFNFNFVDEVGDVFLVVTDKDTMNWVGIKWTPEGVEVYNKYKGYMTKYTDTYLRTSSSIDGDVTSPSIKADVVINFCGSTVPFKAQTSLSLVEHEGQYRLLGSMTIDGVTAETPLIRTHLGMINRSAVLTNLFKRLESQKHQQPTQPRKETATMQSKNQQEKVEAVPMAEVKMTGDITVNGRIIVTITSNMNNKTSTINWSTNCVQIIDPYMESASIIVPTYPIVAKKPNGIDSHNQELKCVCANVMLSIYNDRLTDAKVYLAMTGEKLFRKLVGFITIGDETIVMPEVPLTPRMIEEIQILQTLLTTLTDQPELELPDMETKTPCFTPLTPNPIPQPIFNPYGPHPSQQFNQQPSFNPFNPHPSFGPTPYPPQQPPVGYYPPSGMGQGLHPNPSHQPAHSVVFTGPEVGAQYTTNNSVLGQMNGLNQRVNTQQQPNATKEEIKDQAAFWSNFLK